MACRDCWAQIEPGLKPSESNGARFGIIGNWLENEIEKILDWGTHLIKPEKQIRENTSARN